MHVQCVLVCFSKRGCCGGLPGLRQWPKAKHCDLSDELKPLSLNGGVKEKSSNNGCTSWAYVPEQQSVSRTSRQAKNEKCNCRLSPISSTIHSTCTCMYEPEYGRFDAESKYRGGSIVSSEIGVDLINKLELIGCTINASLGSNQENPLMGKTSIVRPSNKKIICAFNVLSSSHAC